MFSRATSILILAAITLQGVFGSLRENVVICLGGSHEHAPVEVVEHCHMDCSHHHHDPAPETPDHHQDDHHDDHCCECTDIELGLVVLLAAPRSTETELELKAAPAPSFLVATTWQAPIVAHFRGPPPKLKDDPGGRYRLAVICSTRLLL